MVAREKLMEKIGEFLDRRKEWRGAPDALTYMMKQSEEELSRKELKEVAMELLLTGHVTAGSAACSLLLYLGRNREVITASSTDHCLFLKLDCMQLIMTCLLINYICPLGFGVRKGPKHNCMSYEAAKWLDFLTQSCTDHRDIARNIEDYGVKQNIASRSIQCVLSVCLSSNKENYN